VGVGGGTRGWHCPAVTKRQQKMAPRGGGWAERGGDLGLFDLCKGGRECDRRYLKSGLQIARSRQAKCWKRLHSFRQAMMLGLAHRRPLIVEFLSKTDSGYPRDAGVCFFESRIFIEN